MKLQNFLIEHGFSSPYPKCALRWTPVRYGTILNGAKRPRICREKSLLLLCASDRFFSSHRHSKTCKCSRACSPPPNTSSILVLYAIPVEDNFERSEATTNLWRKETVRVLRVAALVEVFFFIDGKSDSDVTDKAADVDN